MRSIRAEPPWSPATGRRTETQGREPTTQLCRTTPPVRLYSARWRSPRPERHAHLKRDIAEEQKQGGQCCGAGHAPRRPHATGDAGQKPMAPRAGKRNESSKELKTTGPCTGPLPNSGFSITPKPDQGYGAGEKTEDQRGVMARGRRRNRAQLRCNAGPVTWRRFRSCSWAVTRSAGTSGQALRESNARSRNQPVGNAPIAAL